MIKLHSDVIYPVDQDPIDNGVVICKDDGTIVALGHRSDFEESELQYLPGCLIPGFINTHCHLEFLHHTSETDRMAVC